MAASLGQLDERTFKSFEHTETCVTSFSSAVDGLISLSKALARPFPLSHLMRWRTSEDSSVISPERLLRLHGRMSSSSRMTRTMPQTAIRV